MTWNIGQGGLDPHTGSDDRFWRQVELIRKIQPDILCLQEAWEWNDNGRARLLVFERATGLRSFLAPSPSGMHTLVAVNASVVWPLKHSAHHGWRHCWSALTVELKPFPLPVTVVSAHLSDLDGDTRLHEAAQLVDLAHRPAIVAGSLHCPGLDEPPADLTALPPAQRCHYALPATPGPDGRIDPNQPLVEDRRAVLRLLQAGFTDTAPTRADTTMPAPATTGYTEPRYERRHDHILTSPHLTPHITPASYTILDTEDIRTLSPHLPVLVELATH